MANKLSNFARIYPSDSPWSKAGYFGHFVQLQVFVLFDACYDVYFITT